MKIKLRARILFREVLRLLREVLHQIHPKKYIFAPRFKTMRILFFLLLVTTTLFSQKTHRWSDLDEIKGLYYIPNTPQPFTGTGIEKHPDGQKIMEVPVKEGKINGTVREWAPSGLLLMEVNYKEGKKEGSEKGWYNNGKPRIELVNVNDLPEGKCLEWHNNGKMKSEGVYRNGVETGLHVWWHDNGNKDQETNFEEGKIVGLFQSWYRDGAPRLKINYQKGLKTGMYQEWYENGQLKIESFYLNGKAVKTTTTWSPKGQLWGIQYFQDGEIIKEENYRSGNIEMKNGYMEVINKSDIGINIPIIGSFVAPKTAPVPTYNVEGKVIQIFITPIDSLGIEKEASEEAQLAKYRKIELQKIEKLIGKTLVSQEENRPIGNRKALLWKFDPQQEAVKNVKKVIEEQYLSLKVGNYILSLYSPVLENPTAHKELLLRLASGITVQDKPIELSSLAAKIREEGNRN